MKRFATLLFGLYAISALAQASTQNDAGTSADAVPTSARLVSANEIPCEYGLPANASYGTVPLGLASVAVIIDEKGKVQSARIAQTSGNAAFDDLALSQSRLATCKPFPGLFGKSIPIETTFVFVAGPAHQPLPQKIRRLVHSHLVWHGDSVSLPTVISVKCAPDGKLLSATIVQSSGNFAWDAAALNAVRLSDPLPTDDSGKTPALIKITLYQQEPVPKRNAGVPRSWGRHH
ncbi:TonB family protein [Paraburkholderia sp. BR10923]|uniref:TonB family protein n=1 Tax=Paraburkholderia sp. BR10923 TaxID=3236992 RepID=UPI0034CE2C76